MVHVAVHAAAICSFPPSFKPLLCSCFPLQPGRNLPALRLTLLHSKNKNMAVLVKALLDELLAVSWPHCSSLAVCLQLMGRCLHGRLGCR